MICPRCKSQMKDIKRKGGFHGNTKYECKKCNYKRFMPNKKNKNRFVKLKKTNSSYKEL